MRVLKSSVDFFPKRHENSCTDVLIAPKRGFCTFVANARMLRDGRAL